MKCVCMSLDVPPPLAPTIMPLKKTAVCNASDFNVGVAETLMKNFYVDDLLKPVESIDSAIQFIQDDARKICQRGGFNLTKFTSNRKGVLKSVPENHRKDGVNNIDLDSKLQRDTIKDLLGY